MGEYNLERFLTAQESSYAGYQTALSEMTNGRKVSHWIWYIFPQEKGLGHSYNSQFYGLDGVEEARAYLEHQVLGAGLREITGAVLAHRDKNVSINAIMGSGIDVRKLRSCMSLFNQVAPNDIFQEVLDAFFPRKEKDRKYGKDRS